VSVSDKKSAPVH